MGQAPLPVPPPPELPAAEAVQQPRAAQVTQRQSGGGGLTEQQFRQHLIQEQRLMCLEYRRMYHLIARTAARQDRQYSHLLERLDHADQQHQEVVCVALRISAHNNKRTAGAYTEVGTRSAVRSPAKSAVQEVEQLGRITGPPSRGSSWRGHSSSARGRGRV
ncbi:hypothetical protein EOD39_16762 [Acipenser ruthenus]|uniref:Uncharacterized protein n=1 Tax=Acipenser ruthenus TaxID=7906 RepID=A0A444U8X0_ACIRT|nr:hypothetical protein EOD39_16762 [Acipenser ruthenus]